MIEFYKFYLIHQFKEIYIIAIHSQIKLFKKAKQNARLFYIKNPSLTKTYIATQASSLNQYASQPLGCHIAQLVDSLSFDWQSLPSAH